MKSEAIKRLTTNVATKGTYLTVFQRWGAGASSRGPSALRLPVIRREDDSYSLTTGAHSQTFQKIVGDSGDGEMFAIAFWSYAVTAGNWKIVTP